MGAAAARCDQRARAEGTDQVESEGIDLVRVDRQAPESLQADRGGAEGRSKVGVIDKKPIDEGECERRGSDEEGCEGRGSAWDGGEVGVGESDTESEREIGGRARVKEAHLREF